MNSIVLSLVDTKTRAKVIAAFKEEVFLPGKTVVKKGDKLDSLMIIKAGTAAFTRTVLYFILFYCFVLAFPKT